MPDLAASRARLLGRFGRSVTIARGAATATCLGTLTRPRTEPIDGGPLAQTGWRLEIMAAPLDAAGFPVPPRNPDTVAVGGALYLVAGTAAEVMDGAERIGWSMLLEGG